MIELLTKMLLLAAASVLSFGAAAQADWPARPVRMIIPFPPGGTLDTVGRLLAQKLAEQTGQPFVVENRPGGNATIGADAVAKAPADGYTLLFNASAFISNPMTMKTVPYEVVRDFTPIALVAKAPLSVAVNKELPVTDIASLISYAKRSADNLSFAVGSIGSAGHLATERFKRAAGIDFLIVPYKGTAPAFKDLIGGQIDGFIDPILGSLAFHKSGALRVVAVTSEARAPNLPDVPTVAETIPGFRFYSWYGLWGPSGLAAQITQRLNTEVNQALAGDMRDRLAPQGLLLTPGTVQDFVGFQQEEIKQAQKIVDEGKIRVE